MGFKALKIQPLAVFREAILGLAVCICSLSHYEFVQLGWGRESQRNPGCLSSQTTENILHWRVKEGRWETWKRVTDGLVAERSLWQISKWELCPPPFQVCLVDHVLSPQQEMGRGAHLHPGKNFIFHSGHPRAMAFWIQVPNSCRKALKTPGLTTLVV